jgi:hypothetical protein
MSFAAEYETAQALGAGRGDIPGARARRKKPVYAGGISNYFKLLASAFGCRKSTVVQGLVKEVERDQAAVAVHHLTHFPATAILYPWVLQYASDVPFET